MVNYFQHWGTITGDTRPSTGELSVWYLSLQIKSAAPLVAMIIVDNAWVCIYPLVTWYSSSANRHWTPHRRCCQNDMGPSQSRVSENVTGKWESLVKVEKQIPCFSPNNVSLEELRWDYRILCWISLVEECEYLSTNITMEIINPDYPGLGAAGLLRIPQKIQMDRRSHVMIIWWLSWWLSARTAPTRSYIASIYCIMSFVVWPHH
jgi:hypothetical protein